MFFSHNKPVGTVFFSQVSDQQTGPSLYDVILTLSPLYTSNHNFIVIVFKLNKLKYVVLSRSWPIKK